MNVFPREGDLVRVTTDASEKGIGGVLKVVRNGKELLAGCVSRTLRDAETRYAAVEWEALAVHWAVSKWSIYLRGRPFEVYSDQEALQKILGRGGDLNKHQRKRIDNWRFDLLAYDFVVYYKRGVDNVFADYLSRMGSGSNEAQVRVVLRSGRRTEEEKTEEGWDGATNGTERGEIDEDEFRALQRKELEAGENADLFQQGMDGLWKDKEGRVYVPRKFRRQMMHLIHRVDGAHLSVSKTRYRVAEKLTWPGLAADVRSYVSGCQACQRFKATRPGKNFRPLAPVRSTFERVSMDLISGLPSTLRQKKYIMVVVDHYTRYMIAVPLTNKSAETVAWALWDDWISM